MPAWSLKVTVPVGMPTLGETALTLTEKVTGNTSNAGLTLDVTSPVEVLALLTVCTSRVIEATSLLPAKLPSWSVKVAVIVCTDADNVAVVNVARLIEPPTSPFPRGPFWSLKVTMPSGMPAPGETALTAAAKVTTCP